LAVGGAHAAIFLRALPPAVAPSPLACGMWNLSGVFCCGVADCATSRTGRWLRELRKAWPGLLEARRWRRPPWNAWAEV
jgi:hypothetical protein